MNISIKFIWFDIWVGVFIDLKKRHVYVAPFPCIVIIFQWGVCYSVKIDETYKIAYRLPNLEWLVRLIKAVRGRLKSLRTKNRSSE